MYAVRAAGIGLMALLAAACQQTKSANPLSPDIAGPIPGVAITAPKPLEPFANQTIESTQQPLDFLIENAGTSGVRPLFLQFQLAADNTFSQVLHQADRLSPGANGRTTYRLTQTLGAGGTYYWRTRAFDGANTGPWSAATAFALTEPVVIETPVPQAPLGQVDTLTPQFVVRNGRISGPAGPVVYRIELGIAPDPGAVSIVLSAGVGSSGTTAMAAGSAAPYATTIYWRTYATNGAIESARSAWVAFRTPNAPPSGGGGGGTGGGGGGGGTVGPPRSIGIDEVVDTIYGIYRSAKWDIGSRSSRDQRNRYLEAAVAAIHFGHSKWNPRGPDANWCIKTGGPNRPQSDEAVVRCSTREAWDLWGGIGGDNVIWSPHKIEGTLDAGQAVYAPNRSSTSILP